jgi:hypothetical protein
MERYNGRSDSSCEDTDGDEDKYLTVEKTFFFFPFINGNVFERLLGSH